jgi:protein-S-isoprenylcysteine O-methyltransferase Ste14
MAVCILVALVSGAAYWTRAYPAVHKSLFIVGMILASFGATGRAWAIAYISGHKLKSLVQTGPYSLCRNPLYFFSMILAIGFGFCTGTVTIPILIFVTMTVLYHFQIKREERRLIEVFGDEYQRYSRTTPRFIPTFMSYSEPEMICVEPRLLMKGLFGIAFLQLLIAVVVFLEVLHDTNLVPTFFYIY